MFYNEIQEVGFRTHLIKLNKVKKMVQAIITLGEHEDRVLTIVKGKYGLKNKSQAINLVIEMFEEQLLEPQLRPEYIKELKRIDKQKGIPFKSVAELRKHIEKA